ncbi:MAG: glyoxalase/bleomycin resistance/extradiol dioxygenase family protein [Myxococcales bacterium]|nr:glyoxalase/bleomycin resistance/extradiol dioxygenase family protein [Myxococcales bacterium]
MITEATPFLNFNGDCHEAIALYGRAFGATVVDRRGWDPAMFGGELPPGFDNGVMYARLTVGSVPLEMSDVPPGMTVEAGSNLCVNLHVTEADELDRCFAVLAEGGNVVMPPEDMFWGARYGKVVDRFGIAWSLHCQLA